MATLTISDNRLTNEHSLKSLICKQMKTKMVQKEFSIECMKFKLARVKKTTTHFELTEKQTQFNRIN